MKASIQVTWHFDVVVRLHCYTSRHKARSSKEQQFYQPKERAQDFDSELLNFIFLEDVVWCPFTDCHLNSDSK
jgi:hypothetical protein